MKYRNFPKHFVTEMFEKLAHLLASWHANLKHWHVMWYVGTFIRTLPRNYKELARF